MTVAKKRVIKSLENLTEDLRGLLREQYPNGYESSITRITNAKKEPIFVFPLETDDSVYLVKVPATKNSDGGYDVESGKKQEFTFLRNEYDIVAGNRLTLAPAFEAGASRAIFEAITAVLPPLSTVADLAAGLAGTQDVDPSTLVRRLAGVLVFGAALGMIGVWRFETRDF